LDSPCGRIDGGFAAVRQAKLAANAPKREFLSRYVGGQGCLKIRKGKGKQSAASVIELDFL
jgi:hypothetical protein